MYFFILVFLCRLYLKTFSLTSVFASKYGRHSGHRWYSRIRLWRIEKYHIISDNNQYGKVWVIIKAIKVVIGKEISFTKVKNSDLRFSSVINS